MRFFRKTCVVVTAVVATGSLGKGVDYDPVKDFCKRFYHQTAQIGNRLYIDGGVATKIDSPSTNFTNTRFTFHNLDDDTKKAAPLVANLSKPDNVPSVYAGTLWADQSNEKLYLFGGEYFDGPPSVDKGLWSYDPWVDKWKSIDAGGQRVSHPSFGMGVSVEHNGLGFYLGGWLGPNNTPGWTGPKVALNSMIQYDMVNNIFRNITGPPGDPRVEGVILFVPAGDDGLLVTFGGMYARGGSERNLRPAPMNEVDVFDISQGKWARTNATGDIPQSRRRFCGGVAHAEDNSSFNAYIYGGASTVPTSGGTDDVYILSMPSFKWVKYWDGDPRSAHNGFSCNVINNSQMVVIGGAFPHDNSTCDLPTAAGSHYLDLGRANEDNSEWYGYRKNLKLYQVPTEVTKVVGGGPEGGATATQPDGGFENAGLRTLFSRKFTPARRDPTRTPTPTASTDTTKPGPNVGGIVGPSVGVGLPFLAASAIGIWWFFRRRRMQSPDQSQDHEHGYGTTPKGIYTPANVYQLPTTQSPKFGTPGFPHIMPPIYPGVDGRYHKTESGSEVSPVSPSKDDQHQYPSELEAERIQPSELPAGHYSIGPDKKQLSGLSLIPPPPKELEGDVGKGNAAQESRNTSPDSETQPDPQWKIDQGQGHPPGII